MKSKFFIGVDFDGTVVEHDYPKIGAPVDGALEVLEELINNGHKIILFTMRCGDRLEEAVEYLENNGIKLYAVNTNPTQKYWTESPKVFCHLYIDDAALGCPLIIPQGGKPYVDWEEVRTILVDRGILVE